MKTAAPGREAPYAATLLMIPQGTISAPDHVQLSPILDLLNVRYVVFRGTPPPDIHPQFQSVDYWILVNSNALPRVFVPASVQTAPPGRELLEKLNSAQFDPAAVAYVESAINLPSVCRGTAEIMDAIPTRITVSVHLKTPGLIVLADNWDPGWRARWNGQAVPVLRVDYAIRGVVLPAGTGTLELVYRPASLSLGLWLAGGAVLVLLTGLVALRRQWMKSHGPLAVPSP